MDPTVPQGPCIPRMSGWYDAPVFFLLCQSLLSDSNVWKCYVVQVTSTTAVLTTDLTGATSALPLTVCVAVDNANDFAPAGRPQSLDVGEANASVNIFL